MTKLRKIGDSTGVLIPANVLKNSPFNEGDNVRVEYNENSRKLEISKEYPTTCEELFEGWNGEYVPEPYDWGEDVGEEKWYQKEKDQTWWENESSNKEK